MEETTHPYAKLSQTPLARQTTVCGLPAKTASFVMGLFALVVVSGSHFALGVLLIRARSVFADDDDSHEDSDESDYPHQSIRWGMGGRDESILDKAEKSQADHSKYMGMTLVGGMAIFSGIATAITSIIILVGALKVKPALFMPWFITMSICMVLGRAAPLMVSLSGANPYTKFFILMTVIDGITMGILTICWGQLAGEHRNKKYMNYHKTPNYNVKPGDGQSNAGNVLLPPGSYPQQVA